MAYMPDQLVGKAAIHGHDLVEILQDDETNGYISTP